MATVNKLPFPLQFKRQYDAPLDSDMVFETVATLTEYLNNPLRYPGQAVSCLEKEGSFFILNNAKNSWIEVGGTGTLTFKTRLALDEYLTDEKRYAGMLCTCEEAEGSIFVLNTAKDSWIEFTNDESNLVHKTLNEIISGQKRFTSDILMYNLNEDVTESNVPLLSSTEEIDVNGDGSEMITVTNYQFPLSEQTEKNLKFFAPDLFETFDNEINKSLAECGIKIALTNVETSEIHELDVESFYGLTVIDNTVDGVRELKIADTGLEFINGTIEVISTEFIKRTIKNLAEPKDDDDAVPKKWAETLIEQKKQEVIDYYHAAESHSRIIYVNSGLETGDNNGTSWANAFTSLVDAFEIAYEGDRIFIAGGTYFVTKNNDVSEYLTPKSRCKIIGGFSGSETDETTESLASQRKLNPDGTYFYETVISGDFTGNDVKAEWSEQLIMGTDGTRDEEGALIYNKIYNLLFDGIIFEKTNKSNTNFNETGAIHLDGGSTTFNKCIIRNIDSVYVAGLHIVKQTELNIFDCKFDNLKCTWYGAGYIYQIETVRIYNTELSNLDAVKERKGGAPGFTIYDCNSHVDNMYSHDSYGHNYGSTLLIGTSRNRDTNITYKGGNTNLITNLKVERTFDGFGTIFWATGGSISRNNSFSYLVNSIFHECKTGNGLVSGTCGDNGEIHIVNCSFIGNNAEDRLTSSDITIERGFRGKVYIYNTLMLSPGRALTVEGTNGSDYDAVNEIWFDTSITTGQVISTSQPVDKWEYKTYESINGVLADDFDGQLIPTKYSKVRDLGNVDYYLNIIERVKNIFPEWDPTKDYYGNSRIAFDGINRSITPGACEYPLVIEDANRKVKTDIELLKAGVKFGEHDIDFADNKDLDIDYANEKLEDHDFENSNPQEWIEDGSKDAVENTIVPKNGQKIDYEKTVTNKPDASQIGSGEEKISVESVKNHIESTENPHGVDESKFKNPDSIHYGYLYTGNTILTADEDWNDETEEARGANFKNILNPKMQLAGWHIPSNANNFMNMAASSVNGEYTHRAKMLSTFIAGTEGEVGWRDVDDAGNGEYGLNFVAGPNNPYYYVFLFKDGYRVRTTNFDTYIVNNRQAISNNFNFSPGNTSTNGLCFTIRFAKVMAHGEFEVPGWGDIPQGTILDEVYIGNDGKEYRCAKLGSYAVMIEGLRETKFSDGSDIRQHTTLDGIRTANDNYGQAVLIYPEDNKKLIVQKDKSRYILKTLVEKLSIDSIPALIHHLSNNNLVKHYFSELMEPDENRHGSFIKISNEGLVEYFNSLFDQLKFNATGVVRASGTAQNPGAMEIITYETLLTLLKPGETNKNLYLKSSANGDKIEYVAGTQIYKDATTNSNFKYKSVTIDKNGKLIQGEELQYSSQDAALNNYLETIRPVNKDVLVKDGYLILKRMDVIYGYKYNHYALRDAKGLINTGDGNLTGNDGWRLPDSGDRNILFNYGIDQRDAGTPITLISHDSLYNNVANPKAGKTNNTQYTAKDLNFAAANPESWVPTESSSWKQYPRYWTSTQYVGVGWRGMEMYGDYQVHNFTSQAEACYCVRLVRNPTTEEQGLEDGTIIENAYIGNDGKVYRATKIGNYVWLAQNLAETLFDDGSAIETQDYYLASADLASTSKRQVPFNDEKLAYGTITEKVKITDLFNSMDHLRFKERLPLIGHTTIPTAFDVACKIVEVANHRNVDTLKLKKLSDDSVVDIITTGGVLVDPETLPTIQPDDYDYLITYEAGKESGTLIINLQYV